MSAPAQAPPARVVATAMPGGRRRRRLLRFDVLAVVLALAATVLVLYPLGTTLGRVLFVDHGYRTMVDGVRSQRDLGDVLLNTLIVTVVSVVIATVIGCAFAWLSERTDAGMGWFTGLLPIFPMLVPPVAGAAGWIVLGAPAAGYLNVFLRKVADLFGVHMVRGPLDIGSWYGLIGVYVLYLVPLVFVTVAAALRNVDPALEEASRASGAGPGRTLRRITIPAVQPAVGAGILLAIIYALSLFSVGALIGYPAGIEILSVRIVYLMREFPVQLHAAVGLGFIVIAVIGFGLWLQRRLLRSNRFATISGRSARAVPLRLGFWRWPARIAMVLYVLMTAVIPIVALVLVSIQPFWSARINLSRANFNRYVDLFTGSQTAAQALRNSILLATIGATIVMLVAAVVSAYSSRRSSSLVGRAADFSTKLPGAISHILIGVAFIGAFAGPPFNLAHTLTILLLAYIVITLPQASFAASAAYSQVGRELEEASLTAGASQMRTFGRIVLPLMVPGLAAGWALVFVLIAGDLTASAMLAGPGNPVVGQFMLDEVNFGTYGSLTTIAVALSLVSSVVVFAFLGITRRLDVSARVAGGPKRSRRSRTAAFPPTTGTGL